MTKRDELISKLYRLVDELDDCAVQAYDLVVHTSEYRIEQLSDRLGKLSEQRTVIFEAADELKKGYQ